MEQKALNKKFNKRSFIAMSMLISGIFLPFSGFMNHHLQFDELTIERHFWMSIHNISAILFTLFIILHISNNWQAMVKYIKKAKEISISKETISALVFVLIIVGLFSLHAFHVD